MTVRTWIAEAAAALGEAGVESPRLEARVLAAAAAGMGHASLAAHPEAQVPEAAQGLLERRLSGEPLAYVVGRREFWGRDFAVGPGVLVPRQETETLVGEALALEQDECCVLDLGTGSGCLAVTIALERPGWSVAASDVSAEALALAASNAEALGARVEFRLGDLAGPWEGRAFDLVVCNPPYVAEGAPLPAEVARYEPGVALYAGADGLDFYRRLAAEARRLLAPQGRLLVELGDGTTTKVEEVFVRDVWRPLGTARDLSGWDRAAWFAP